MSLTDYTDLEKEINELPEPQIADPGTEVYVRIVSVNSDISNKNDCRWYMPVFEDPENPLLQEFNDFFWDLDKEKLTAKQFTSAVRKFRNFAKCFEIDFSRPFSWEDDLPGKEGWVIVGVRDSEDYGKQNTVKKYISPR